MTPESDPSAARIGRVYLVGAGPGDAGLITLRGVECLRRADAVLYDYLVNPAILAHSRPDAELVCLGRHGRGQRWSQDDINAELVSRACRGQTVVRLKGGDPAVFAHMAEEAEALLAADISFEVAPGVTAALAVASFAGVPLTHRDYASAVALVTGQQRDDEATIDMDYGALAAFPGTLVIYMGTTTAESWSAKLIAAGKPGETPVAVVRRCSLPDQQRWFCHLDEVGELIARGPIRPPALVVIGEVAALGSKFDWFSRRPLFGRRILITRAAEQNDALRALLIEHGADVLEQPAIEIAPASDQAAVDAAIGRFPNYDWLVFSSANGVEYFFDRVMAMGDVRRLGQIKIAAIGPGTADALLRYHLHADVMPVDHRAEALADAVIESIERENRQQTKRTRSHDAAALGQRCLLIRANRGREVLAERLTAAGAVVEQVVVYQSTDVAAADAEIAERLSSGRIDWITVTSSAIARSLIGLFGESLRKARLASISPLTTGVLQEGGFAVAAEAADYTMPGVVAAILKAESAANSAV